MVISYDISPFRVLNKIETFSRFKYANKSVYKNILSNKFNKTKTVKKQT